MPHDEFETGDHPHRRTVFVIGVGDDEAHIADATAVEPKRGRPLEGQGHLRRTDGAEAFGERHLGHEDEFAQLFAPDIRFQHDRGIEDVGVRRPQEISGLEGSRMRASDRARKGALAIIDPVPRHQRGEQGFARRLGRFGRLGSLEYGIVAHLLIVCSIVW